MQLRLFSANFATLLVAVATAQYIPQRCDSVVSELMGGMACCKADSNEACCCSPTENESGDLSTAELSNGMNSSHLDRAGLCEMRTVSSAGTAVSPTKVVSLTLPATAFELYSQPGVTPSLFQFEAPQRAPPASI